MAFGGQERRAGLAWLTGFALAFDTVDVVSARPGDLAAFEQWGFRRDVVAGGVFSGHFEPCPLRLEIVRDRETPALRLRYGVSPARQAVPGYVDLDPDGARRGASRVSVAVARAACGEGWVFAEEVATGTLAPLRCDGAASRDGVVTLDPRTGKAFVCYVEGAGRAYP